MDLQKPSTLAVKKEFAVKSNSIINYELPLKGPSHSSAESFLPASSIVDPMHNNLENTYTKDKLLFCFRALVKTINSCLSGKYTDFDGHTTSNCCHGIALLAFNLINSVLQLDLKAFLHEGEQKIQLLEQAVGPQPCTWWIPKSLINLASLYVLNYIKESDPVKGDRTITKKLMDISPLSQNACKLLAYDLQKRFSNWIALRYADFVTEIGSQMEISGAPLTMWGKYITPNNLRTDKRGVKYASNLFSMQVVFATLIRSEAKIALINDIKDSSGNLKERCVCIFEGDGENQLKKLSIEEIKDLNFFHQNDPIIVYGGCVYSDTLNKDDFSLQLQISHDCPSKLLLSCDIFYPQFSRVTDDPNFDSSSIIPEEKLLQNIICERSKTKGVSAADPSFYCATHIYPASMKQVLQVLNEQCIATLPISYIPELKKDSN